MSAQFDFFAEAQRLESLRQAWFGALDYDRAGPISRAQEEAWGSQMSRLMRTPPQSLMDCAIKLTLLTGNVFYEIGDDGGEDGLAMRQVIEFIRDVAQQ
jgi:hypothetical protein